MSYNPRTPYRDPDERVMRREYPPRLPRDIERERCAHCNSRGLLMDGYCACGAVVCKLCLAVHRCEYD